MTEVMAQLFINGPTWDGNIISKDERDDLVDAGFVDRDNGWNFLTVKGVREAVRLSRHTKDWHDDRVYQKGWQLK